MTDFQSSQWRWYILKPGICFNFLYNDYYLLYFYHNPSTLFINVVNQFCTHGCMPNRFNFTTYYCEFQRKLSQVSQHFYTKLLSATLVCEKILVGCENIIIVLTGIRRLYEILKKNTWLWLAMIICYIIHMWSTKI